MKTNDSRPATDVAGNRREFLRAAGRWGGAAALVGLLAWVERPRTGRGGVCLDAPACARCPEWPECVRPEALQKQPASPNPQKTNPPVKPQTAASFPRP
jgi:hypothetical protein